MVDSLILLLFLISGAATGWLGVDLLPESLLLQVNNPEGLRTVLGGSGPSSACWRASSSSSCASA